MPAAFDFVEDTTAKSFDFQADPIPTPEPAPTISPTAQLAKARLAFAPLAGQAVANLPDKPLITLPEWPKGEGSLEEQITGQVYGKLKDFLGFMTSPKGVAVTGAAVAAPEVAGPIISAAMLPAAVEEGIGTVTSIGKGDIPGAAGHLTGLTLTGAGVLGGVAQFLPRTVAEARVPVETPRAPEPITIPEPAYTGPTPPKIAAVEQAERRAAIKAARPVVPETLPEPERGMTILDEIRAAGADTKAKIQKLFPQLSRETAAKLRDQAFPREKQPDNISRAEVDRLFLDKLNEESNREIEAASATPKPAPVIPEVRKIALEQQKASGWNPDWPFVPADLMNKSFRDAIRSDPALAAEEKAKILSFGPKDEPATAPETPPAISAPEAKDLVVEGPSPEFPDLPKDLARFDKGPSGYLEDVAFQRERDQGWEKYYDQTSEQRATAFSQVVNDLSKGVGQQRAFAQGWMDAMDQARKSLAEPTPPAKVEAPAAKPVAEAAPIVASAKVEQQVKTVAKIEGQRSAKEIKSELVSRLEQSIKDAPSESEVRATSYTKADMERVEVPDRAEMVTIEIPGDGTFKIRNTKEALGEILKRAKRIGTASTAGRTVGKVAKEELTPDLAAKQAVQIYGQPRAAINSLERQLSSGQEIDPGTRFTTERAIELLRDELPEVKLDKQISETSKAIEEKQTAIKIAEERMRVRQQMSSTRTAMKDQRFAEEQLAEINEARQSISENQKKLARLQRERAAFPKPPETPPTGPGMAAQPATPEARLSQSLQSVPKQKPPPQGPAAQPMGITPFPGLVTGLQKIAQSAQRVWHEIADVPKFAPFKRVINKFNGDTQRTSLKIRQMQADIESRVPDPKRLEAITNWLQADGDVAKLRAWEAASRNATRRQGYRDAQRLTPYEVQVAKAIRQYYDDLLARGQAYGILDQAKDDYVTQIWKRPLLGGAQFAQFASKLSRTFKFGMKSVFENFFEGEQAGYKPVTKNISKLLGVYVSELEKTIATRDMIRDLTHETASDGNPLAKVEGTAHIAQDQAGDPTGPMFVRPGVVKGDVRYAELNHPALKNWKWISKDPESGRDVFILGELRVHPEIRRHLSNVLSQSQIRKWMREPSETELANIVKLAARFGDTTSKVVKQTMLGTLSTFHHVQEGTHGLGHRANAFLPPKLPVGTPELNYALDHGLQLAGEGAALENFREGLGSHGVFDKVPVLGKWIEKHNDLLFNEYIPRLKWDTWQRINRRNMARYQKEIASGEVTADDVAYLSSKQTNAAFGHQNYADLGRNATVQHVLRLFALAPDFLEARTRFAGQAAQGLLSKVGREQLEALSLLGGLFYIGARIGNKLSDDDYHWEEPFRVKYGNRWYGMRSVPEDLWRAFNDTRVFAYNRLNPVFGRPTMELLSGVNYRGEKIPASEVFKNILVSGIPIQMREFPAFRSLTETQRNTTIGAWEQFLSSVGVQVSRYSPLNQTYKLATKWRKAQGEKEAPTTYPVSKYQPLRYALEDHDLTRAADELAKLTEGGKVPLTKIAQGFRVSLHRPFSGSLANEGKFVASLTPDQKALYKEAIAQRSRVWREFTNAEQEYHNRLKQGR